VANKKPLIYIDSCCFTELATFDRFAILKDADRLNDVRALRDILDAHLAGELEVFTSTISISECQYVKDPADPQNKAVFDEEVRSLFRSLLMSGKFAFLVQDTVLVAEQAVNLRWVHGMSFGGADAMHLASALAAGCVEFLTFDGSGGKKGILSFASELFETFGIKAIRPRDS
jgi:predicted nucleic acid-binding protein